GEILGIAGVEGNGQSELMEVLAGTRRATGRQVLLAGRGITTMDANTERDAGVAFIPEDRRGTGLVLSFSIAENSILGRERTPTFSWRHFVLNLIAIRNWALKLVKEFDIRTPSIEVAVRNLSGGNQQKVIVAREIGTNPKVLLAAQPTRGVDIGAIEFIHRQIVRERDGQLANAGGAPPALRRQLIVGHVLVVPGDLVRDVDRAPAKLNHGDQVGAQRIAYHDELFGLDPAPLKDAAIGVDVLLGEDLDAEKELAET